MTDRDRPEEGNSPSNGAWLSALPPKTTMAAVSASTGPPTSVNLLWLVSDSFDGRFFDEKAPQWQQVALPNLRSIAANGTNFVRAYSNSPQCVPSRSSMMTGRHTHHIGAWSNVMGLAHRYQSEGGAAPDCENAWNETGCQALLADDEDLDVDKACKASWSPSICAQMKQWQPEVNAATPDVLRALRNAGIDVHVYGKVDIGLGFLEEFPNATQDGFRVDGEYGMMNVVTRSADIHGATMADPRDITETNNTKHIRDYDMTDRCVEFFERHNPNEHGWLLYCSLNIPHPPFRTNATWLARVNASAVGLPASFTSADRIGKMHPADQYSVISKNVTGKFSIEEILTTRRVYAAMCMETDYLLGRVLDAAASSGHLNPLTYVLFLSDHGEMAMEHRQVWKNSMYEGSSRVPILLSGPRVAAGARVSGLTSLVDVYPTLLDIFGVPSPAAIALDGTSLLDASALSERQGVVSQYHSNMANTGTFMLRTADGFKYIAYGTSPLGLQRAADFPPQLFHVESDPDELHDLASGGALPANVTAKLAKLDAALRTVVDYPAADTQAKAIDHWLFEQWYDPVNRASEMEASFKVAYGSQFTAEVWKHEWTKAQAWISLGASAAAILEVPTAAESSLSGVQVVLVVLAALASGALIVALFFFCWFASSAKSTEPNSVAGGTSASDATEQTPLQQKLVASLLARSSSRSPASPHASFKL